MFRRAVLLLLVVLTTACVSPSYNEYVYEGNMAGVRELYQQGHDVDSSGSLGWTPLVTAAERNNVEAAKFLIDKGADVNKGTSTAYTTASPMHAAAAYGSVDVARLLLANGADLSIRNRKNDTPLEAARIHEHPEIVALINSVTVERPAWK